MLSKRFCNRLLREKLRNMDMEELAIKKNIDLSILNNLEVARYFQPLKLETVKCFNDYHCITNKTEVLILGSITSKDGLKNGYFYTSKYNQTYELLDCVFPDDTNSFNNIKEKLNNAEISDKPKYIEELKQHLKKHKIAFLDVIHICVRPGNDMSDSAIIYSIPLSKEKLMEYINIGNIRKICYNSDYVLNTLKKIFGCKNIDEIRSELKDISLVKIASPSRQFKKSKKVKK